jgi:hypothetical protein
VVLEGALANKVGIGVSRASPTALESIISCVVCLGARNIPAHHSLLATQ